MKPGPKPNVLRESVRERYPMKDRSFARFWDSYKGLAQLVVMKMVTREEAARVIDASRSADGRFRLDELAIAVVDMRARARSEHPEEFDMLMGLLEVALVAGSGQMPWH